MTATSAPALEAVGLRKSFGTTVALDGVDLRVDPGTIFALLGPNGAGKTTTVQILSTLVRADSGEARVAGHDPARDPDAVRRVIGMTGQFGDHSGRSHVGDPRATRRAIRRASLHEHHPARGVISSRRRSTTLWMEIPATFFVGQ